MIKLSRPDGRTVMVNENFIEITEEAPDTIVTFQNGHRIIVSESVDVILARINEYRRGIYPVTEEKILPQQHSGEAAED